jgi:ornithine cyclodeaminase/alanine dehydrogenase-like protein (mu-crystallin family)
MSEQHTSAARDAKRSEEPAEKRGVLFLSHADTLALLGVQDALDVCESVYRMHARGSVLFSTPASQRLDVGAPFHNHWHVKTAFLKELPATGVRLYNY